MVQAICFKYEKKFLTWKSDDLNLELGHMPDYYVALIDLYLLSYILNLIQIRHTYIYLWTDG